MNKSIKTFTKLIVLASLFGLVVFFATNNATANSANDGVARFEVASFDASCGGDSEKAEKSADAKSEGKEAKCGEGKEAKKADAKAEGKEAKCSGEGKCGEGKAAKKADAKAEGKEAKCGEGKAAKEGGKEAKCGEGKDAKKADAKAEGKEAKCGEGKCGEGKCG